MLDELVENTMKEVINRVDMLPFWQQDVIRRLITQAIQLAYRQGRDDQKYVSEGPRTNLY